MTDSESGLNPTSNLIKTDSDSALHSLMNSNSFSDSLSMSEAIVMDSGFMSEAHATSETMPTAPEQDMSRFAEDFGKLDALLDFFKE